ncbi:regulator of phospholipase d srf1 [Acrodontium crateriforme]|uniref:Regulator of phospholipase d srf1 n=1 Tax=Acrodontium crateriforme TaxID=150365 RepID=A0AAQ3R991_9PEZI|nr:regulator of phospholipase d srf1 [Acrodontium crateriforme]
MQEMQQRSSLAASPAANPSPSRPNHDSQPTNASNAASSIPPWVHAHDISDDAPFLPTQPRPTVSISRHDKPPPSHYRLGRKWDGARDAEPGLLGAPISERQKLWEPFMKSGPNPHEVRHDGSWIATPEWMHANMPYLSQEWDDSWDDGNTAQNRLGQGLMYRGKWLISPERQEKTVRLFWRLLLKNPFVPLAFRLTNLAFSVASLAVATTIYVAVNEVNNDPDPDNQCATRASTYMAICLGTVAIPYLGYVTWDEYLSRPLGLRSVAAKTLLLLCDLYFIVFAASNVSLAFDALLDHRWACYDERFRIVGSVGEYVPATCPDNPGICYKQKALSAVLIVGLVAWLLTFSVSTFRVVEKLRPD